MAVRDSPARGRGRGGRGRGRGGGWRPYPPPPIIRPIFDWSEVREHFPQVAPQLDSTLLTQLLSKRVQEITPSIDEQGTVQGFCSKVSTVLENMILTGEGEELLLDEVRAVGSQKKGTALAGNMVADLVILLRDLPSDTVVKKLSRKLVDVLNSAQEDGGKEGDKGSVTVNNISSNIFELKNPEGAITRVYVTTTGDKVYGTHPREIVDMKPYENALRMIRHARWWEDHTSHLKSVRPLVRILKDMKKHVPGVACLNPWYIELLSNCAVIPLVGDEPFSLVDSFKRVWQLLSAGLFLPGSIGIPDPCEESDSGIHENLPPEESDEITRNAQMILQMLNFGAYREVLAVSTKTNGRTCVVTRDNSTTFSIVISGTTYTLKFNKEEEVCSIETILRTLERQLAEFFRNECHPYVKLLLCGTVYILNFDNQPQTKGKNTCRITFILDHSPTNCTVTRTDEKNFDVTFNEKSYPISFPRVEVLQKFESLFTVHDIVEKKMGTEPCMYPIRLWVTGMVCVLNYERLRCSRDVNMVKTISCFFNVETMQ